MTLKKPEVIGITTKMLPPHWVSLKQDQFQYDQNLNKADWQDIKDSYLEIQNPEIEMPMDLQVKSEAAVPSKGEFPGHTNGSHEHDIIVRTRSVEMQCERMSRLGSPGGHVRDVMTNRNSRLSYCYVPKCGCTFWKRIIRFLNRDFVGKNVASPFEIRRIEVHSQFFNPDTSLPFSVYQKISKWYHSFIFVREPYSRLWSAYIDKLYLPDFWGDFLPAISRLRNVREEKKCVSDVSFSEFLLLTLEIQEPHWDPIYQMCDPCIFKPSIVGRMENFTADSKFILDKANLSWMMEGYNHVTHVKEEMVTLIKYNVELMAVKPNTAECTTKIALFRRLWKTFQINGYLPEDIFPQNLKPGTTTYQFIQIVLDHYRRRPNTPDVWRAQREKFMIEAYRSIPISTMYAIRMKYARDFILFNYDPKPPKIFGNRN